MDQREQFLADYQRRHGSTRALSVSYAISRKTGWRWIARVADEGRGGIVERSRAPHSCPHQTREAVASLIIAARQAHPDGGLQLLLDWLRPRLPTRHDWPRQAPPARISNARD